MTSLQDETSPGSPWQFSLRSLLLAMFAAAIFGTFARFAEGSSEQAVLAVFSALLGAIEVFVLLVGLFASVRRIGQSRRVFGLASLACGLQLTVLAMFTGIGLLTYWLFREYQEIPQLRILWGVVSLAAATLHITAMVALLGAVFHKVDAASSPWLSARLHPLVWLWRLARSRPGRAVLRHFRLPIPRARRRRPAAAGAAAANESSRRVRRAGDIYAAAMLNSEIGALLLPLLIGGVYLAAMSAPGLEDVTGRLRMTLAAFPNTRAVVIVTLFSLGLVTAWKYRPMARRTMRLAVIGFSLLLCGAIVSHVFPRILWVSFTATNSQPRGLWFSAAAAAGQLGRLAGLSVLLWAIHCGVPHKTSSSGEGQ